MEQLHRAQLEESSSNLTNNHSLTTMTQRDWQYSDPNNRHQEGSSVTTINNHYLAML